VKLWRGQPDNWVWKPTEREKARVWLGLAAAFYSLALVAYYSADRSSFGGLLGPFRRLAFNLLGWNGDLVVFAGIGSACLAYGLLKYRAKA
jgi:hypothetical protein